MPSYFPQPTKMKRSQGPANTPSTKNPNPRILMEPSTKPYPTNSSMNSPPISKLAPRGTAAGPRPETSPSP